jgi:hypothetical protein
MHRLVFPLFFALVMAVGMPACGRTPSPSTPVDNPAAVQASEIAGNRHLWGLWHVILDPSTATAEVVPMRTASVGVNVTQFMSPPISPTNMISFDFDIGASDFASGLFVLDVTLKHPFPGLDKYRGFDVRGIFFSDADSSLPGDGALTYAGESGSHLLNPDGYTRWWNSSEFIQPGLFGFTPGKLAPPTHPTAILSPYKYFCDDLGPESPLSDVTLENRGTFSSSNANSRRYEIQFKMDAGKVVFDFNYAVDASWEDLGPDATSFEVSDFPLSANCNEAWWVSLSSGDTDLYYVDDTDKGGALSVDVTVHDWQATAPGGSVLDEVAGINLHSALFNTGMIEMMYAGATLVSEGTGVATWNLTLDSADLNLTESGPIEFWVEVLSSDPNTYAPQFPGGDVYPHADGPLAACIKDSVYVKDTVGQLSPVVTSIDPAFCIQGQTLNDMHVYGENFIPQGLTAVLDNGPDSIPVSDAKFVSATEMTCDLDATAATPGKYDVTVRVDNLSGPGTLEGTLPEGFEVFAPTEEYGWPFVGRNSQRNSLSPVIGPQDISQVWAMTCTAATAPETLLVGVDPDSPGDWLVYIGYYTPSQKAFSAYRASDGSEKWSVMAPSPYIYYRLMAVAPPNAPCPNGETGTVYVWAYAGSSTPEKIMALSAKDGSVLWEYTAPGLGSWLRLERYGLVDNNGDFVFLHADYQAGAYFLRCLDHVDGTTKWVINSGFHQTPEPVLSPDGNTMYVMAGSSDTLRAYDYTVSPPTLKWSLNLGSYLPAEQQSDPIVASDGALYVMSRVSNLVKIIDNGSFGSVAWSTPAYSLSVGAWIQLAEGPDGSIYSLIPIANPSPCYLYRFDPTDGSVINQTGVLQTDFYTGMAIGHDGMIYLGGRGYIYWIAPDCTTLHTFALMGSRHTDAALLDDGSLFVADIQGGILRKFKE